MTGKADGSLLRRVGFPVLALMLLVLAGCVAAGTLAVGGQAAPGPVAQVSPPAPGEGEKWLLPSPEPGRLMSATLFRPAGAGPFPLAIINHGSDQDPYARSRAAEARFPELTSWFLERGYVVALPIRPGNGATGGTYLEDQGACHDADFEKAGEGAARSIDAAVKFLTSQPFIKKDGVVVAGHSTGGWGALAYAARNEKGIQAIIAFAPGRGGRHQGRANENCSPEELVRAAGRFGISARVPSLWLVARNDTYFPLELSRKMFEAYRAGGAPAELEVLSVAQGEGHLLVRTAVWMEALSNYLYRSRPASPHSRT